MSGQPSQSLQSSLPLSQKCDGLVLALASMSIDEPTKPQIAEVPAHLQSLSKFLKTLEDNGSQNCLEEEYMPALDTLQSFVDSISEAKGSLALHADIHGNMVQLEHILLDIRNLFSLHSNVKLCDDASTNAAQLKSLREGFDKIAADMIQATDEILPPIPRLTREGTFTVQEFDVWGQQGLNKTPRFVCPNAFLHKHQITPTARLKFVRFGCLCDKVGESHDGQLEYRARSKICHGLLRENRPIQGAVLGHVSGQAPFNEKDGYMPRGYLKSLTIMQLEMLANLLARNFAINQAKNALDLGHAGSSQDPALPMVLAAKSSFAERGLPLMEIRIETSHNTHTLPWQVWRMYAHHYSDIVNTTTHKSNKMQTWETVPQSRAVVCFGENRKETPGSDTSSVQECTVDIFKDSVVANREHQLGPFWVALSEVTVREGQISLQDVQVNIKFCSVHDAASFAAHIEALKSRLRQLWARGACSGDTRVYFRKSSPAISGSENEGITSVSVICSKSSKKKDDMRIIMSRNERFVCIDMRDKALKVAQQGMPGLFNMATRLWASAYSEFGMPIVEQTNWDKHKARVAKLSSQRQGLSLGGTQVSRDQISDSQEWYRRVEDVKTALRAPDSVQGRHNRVKVCVIDTGFKPEDRYAKKIKAYKDFVEPQNRAMVDNTWHGTTSARIVLSIYDECELYVARVFNTDDTDDKTEPELMAQAIEWALEPQQNVDMISISAGFQHHSPRLQEAVHKASSASKVVFAAASNWGNLGPVAFPARYELLTICIFSTDTLHKGSRFNPDRRPDSHNFALLGEGFEHPRYHDRRMSGTSMATAAAAGLAALILDFARQPDNESIVRVADLGKMAGVIAVFNAMAKRAGEFKCVEPTNLLPSNYSMMQTDQRREYVRETLSRAMDKAN